MTQTKRRKRTPQPFNPERMTTKDAAKFLNVSEQTLRTWRHEGNRNGPPYTPIGAKIIYRQSALEAWMKRREVDPAKL